MPNIFQTISDTFKDMISIPDQLIKTAEAKKREKQVAERLKETQTEKVNVFQAVSETFKETIPKNQKAYFDPLGETVLKQAGGEFGLREQTIKETMMEQEEARETYYRDKRRKERLIKYGVTPELLASPERFISKDYKEPEGFTGSMVEGLKEGYFATIRPSIGYLAEQMGMGLSVEMREWGEEMGDKAMAELFKRPELFAPRDLKKFSEGGFKDSRYYGRTIGNTIPFVVSVMGTTAITGILTGGNPLAIKAAGFGSVAAIEKANAYKTMLEKGINPSDAASAASVYGVIASLIENVFGYSPSKIVLGTQGKKIILSSWKNFLLKELPKANLINILSEGGEEAAQQLVENLVTKWLDNSQPVWEGVAESFPAGAVGSLGFGAVSAIRQTRGTLPMGLSIKDITSEKRQKLELRRERFQEKQAIEKLTLEEKITSARETDLSFPNSEMEESFKEFKKAAKRIQALLEMDEQSIYQRYPKTADKIFTGVSPEVGENELLEMMKDRFPRELAREELAKMKTLTELNERQKLFAERLVRKTLIGKKTPIKKIIKEIQKSPSEKITKREIDLLKAKLKEQRKGAKFGYQKGKEIGEARQQLIKEEAIQRLERKGELKQLRQRILDRVNFIARGVREGTVSTKNQIKEIQEEILDILEASELEPKDRDKFRRTVKNVQTQAQLQKALPKIQERISELQTKAEVRDLKAKIKKEIKATKPKKKMGKPIGKFTADIQRVLDIFRKTINLSKTDGIAKIQDNLQKFQDGVMPPEIALENKIIQLLGESPKELQTLLDKIIQMKNEGLMLSALRDFNIQEDIDRKRNLIINQATGFVGIKEGMQTTGKPKKTTSQKLKASLKSLGSKWIVSWDGLMKILDFNAGVANQKLANAFSVHKQENKYKELQKDYVGRFNKMISSAYGIENKRNLIQKKIIDSNQPIKLGVFANAIGQKVSLEVTKGEMMKMYAEFKDPTLTESFEKGNNFTDKIKQAIESQLTNEDKKLVDGAMKMWREQRETMNPVFSKLNGIDLPFNEFYSPIKRVGFEVSTEKGLGAFIEEATYRRAVNTSSLKSRVKSLLQIDQQNIFDALDRHFTETNYYVAWAEKIRELDMVFKDSRVRFVIEDQYTNKTLSAINNSINDFSTKGNKFARRYKSVDWLRKKFTVGALMIKPAIAAKQMISTVTYMENLSPKEFAEGVIDFWKNPIKNTKILNKESIFIRTRGENMERDIKDAIKTDIFNRYSKRQNFINTLMMNVNLGDKGAILTGSWAMRKARLKQGIELSDVIDEYEKFSNETQQSSDLSQLSEVQRGGSLDELFTMFKSSLRQYFAKELNATKILFQKGGASKENIKKVAKTLTIYHILLPVIFQFIANFGGWDEEDKKEYLRAGILGSINGVFIAGDVIDSIVRAALGLRVWDLELPITDIANDVQRAVRKLDFDDIEIEDVGSALLELTRAGNSLGVPVEQTKNIFKGVQNLMEGDVKNGIGLLLGWSEYALGVKKKKKKPTTRRAKTRVRTRNITRRRIRRRIRTKTIR